MPAPKMPAPKMPAIVARGLRKTYGKTVALDGLDLQVEQGRILGLIGRNGAGKSTALHAILGLIPCEGEISVLDRDPWSDRAALMRDVAFIADVSVLPRWMRVWQALEYLAGVHPRFDVRRAEALLAGTGVRSDAKVSELSKGMVVQLHLALVMAIDAQLLVLDEPTLGLDLPFRKQFYDSLLTDYYDRNRTIVISTHEVDEAQHVFSDVAFVDRGRTVLAGSVDDIESRYSEVMVRPEKLVAARALNPIRERESMGRAILLFANVDRRELDALGEVRAPSMSDLFLAIAGGAQ